MMREAKIIDIHDDVIKKADRDLTQLRKVHDDMVDILDSLTGFVSSGEPQKTSSLDSKSDYQL